MTSFVEIKEKKDGSWEILYPEEGWIPCTCDKCKHKKEAPLTVSFYKPKDYEDAKEYAATVSSDIRITRLTTKIKSDTLEKEKDESKTDTKQSKPAKSD